MCRRSQAHVMNEQLSPIQDVGAGVPPVLGRNRTDLASNRIFIKENHAVGLQHERDARAYIFRRRPYWRADKWAPVKSSNPERKAQNISLADNANGP